MKRSITVITALAALLIFGCDFLLGPHEPAGAGNLVIGFGESGGAVLAATGRAAVPTAEEQAALRYELVLTGPGGQIKTVSLSPGKTFNEQVALGEWRIYAEAYDPGNALIGTGSATVTVRAGINEARVPMRAVSLPDTPPGDTFMAVTGITGVPTSGTAGAPLALTGTVTPANATNQTIVWSVKTGGGTGASISGGNSLSTTAAGTVVVTAAIADGTAAGTPYTQDFPIIINAAFVAVSGITGVPTGGTAGTPLALTGTVAPANANQTIVWSVKNAGTTGAGISGGNSLSTTGAGTVVVTATIAGGMAVGTPYTQDFGITFITLPIYNMVSVSGGTVGSSTAWGNSNNYPLPQTISAFYIGETEITYELWYAVRTWAESNDYIFPANTGREGNDGTDGAAPTGAEREPVTYVSWRDAVVWCNAYSEAMGKTPVYYLEGTSDFSDTTRVLRESEGSGVSSGDGKAEKAVIRSGANGFRLPTEAEWEYAARGGDPTDTTNWTYTYAGSNSINAVVVCSSNSNSETANVGTKAANSLGLHDMSGNVQEWCQDVLGTSRAVRGGSWAVGASDCGVAYPGQYYDPYRTFHQTGFRVVCGQ